MSATEAVGGVVTFWRTCEQCAKQEPCQIVDNEAYICDECIALHEQALKAAMDAAHGFDVEENNGFHRRCSLSKAIERAVKAYCEFPDA